MNRDAILAAINVATERLADLSSAEERDADAVQAATIDLAAARERLAAHDATVERPAPHAEIVDEAPASFGRAAADAIAGKPRGTETVIERTLIADPFGSVVSAQDATLPQHVSLVPAVDAPVRFIDVLARATATSDTVTYIKETGFTNAAAARLAGASTPESELELEKVSEPIANVAHRIRVAEETLSDNSALSAIIDRRGIGGVRKVINNQLLAASNTSNGVKSVVAAATELEYEAGEIIDGILAAKSDLEALGFAPTVVVLSPAQHEAILSAKTTGGVYIGAGPFGSGNGTIWGLQMVVDGALAAGVDALVLDPTCATLYVRDAASVATDADISTNVVTVRVQTRAQVAVEQPEGAVKLVEAA